MLAGYPDIGGVQGQVRVAAGLTLLGSTGECGSRSW